MRCLLTASMDCQFLAPTVSLALGASVFDPSTLSGRTALSPSTVQQTPRTQLFLDASSGHSWVLVRPRPAGLAYDYGAPAIPEASTPMYGKWGRLGYARLGYAYLLLLLRRFHSLDRPLEVVQRSMYAPTLAEVERSAWLLTLRAAGLEPWRAS